MGEVVYLDVVTKLDLPSDRVRENIPKDMDSLVVIGFDSEGEFYFASNKADGGDVLWLLEKAKKCLL